MKLHEAKKIVATDSVKLPNGRILNFHSEWREGFTVPIAVLDSITTAV